MINRVFGAAGLPGAMTPANNFATLLSALQPANKLARQYHSNVMNGVLASAVHKSTVTEKGRAEVMEWLPPFIEKLLEVIAATGKVPDEAKLFAQQVKELQKQMGEELGNFTKVAQEILNFVIAADGKNLLQKGIAGRAEWEKKHPKLAKVGGALFFISWCMGLVMVVKAFQNWSSLSAEQKGKTITSVVQLGLDMITEIPAILDGIKAGSATGMELWNKCVDWFNSEGVAERTGIMQGDIELDYMGKSAQQMEELFDAESGVVKAEDSAWATFFEGAGKVVAVVGVVVSAVFAGFATYDLIEDIENDAPMSQQVLDGIIAASGVLATVCLVVDLFVASTVFAAAAAVLAVVGLIAAIVLMATSKPPNPLEDFMKDTVVPFVKALPKQEVPPGAATSPHLKVTTA